MIILRRFQGENRMKQSRMLSRITLCIAAMLCMALFAVSAVAATENGFTYSVSIYTNTATITNYSGTESELIIPDTLGGYPVTVIGSNAFFENKTIQSVVIPEGVTEIQDAAFQFCSSLENISFPSTLRSIGRAAFNGENKIKSLTLPDSLTTLGANSFICSLVEIYLPDNITTVGTQPFYDTTLLYCKKGSSTAYNLSADTDSYRFCDPADPDWKYRYNDDGGLVFGGYRGSKTELAIPNIYVGISDYALSGNETLKKIYVPDSVTSLGYSALSGNLEEIYLPDGITEAKSGSLGWGSDRILFINKNSQTMNTLLALGDEFTFCDPSDPDWLWQYDEDGTLMLGGYRGTSKAITLPAGATVIADDAFDHERDENLLSIIIPEGYTTIGEYSMSAGNLAHVTLPSTLRSIGYRAFSGCDFTSIQLPEGLETIGEYAFNNCNYLTSLTIPSTVTNISNVIVRYCDDLTTVVLPAEIEYIASGAFGEDLSTVYCYRNTYAQTWAKANSPLVKLISSGTLEGLVKLSMLEHHQYDPDYFVFEVGNSYPFMSGVSLGTLPIDTNYTFTCKSSNTAVANVDGDMVTFLKPGKATLTIGIAERPDVTSLKRTIEVYNPVTSFTVPEAVFVHIDAQDKPTYVMPENIEPASNANPYFRRAEENGWWEWCNTSDRGIYFWPDDRLGAQKGYIESMSGIRQPILFVTYDEIGEVYATAPARPLVIGQVWAPDVTVMVDGAELDKLAYLYTLKTSNSRVAAITDDEMIRAVAPGTATITVTARNSGKTAKFTVTVTEAVTLHLPAALKAVSDEAFIGVSAGEIVIPDGCTEIGARAFADCANLYEVTIPASVSTIADDAFEGCADVNIIAPEGSAGHASAEANSANGFTFTAM